jgi:hypothetical protein
MRKLYQKVLIVETFVINLINNNNKETNYMRMNEEFELRLLASQDIYEQPFYIPAFIKRFRSAINSEENRIDMVISVHKDDPNDHVSDHVNMHDLLESMNEK